MSEIPATCSGRRRVASRRYPASRSEPTAPTALGAVAGGTRSCRRGAAEELLLGLGTPAPLLQRGLEVLAENNGVACVNYEVTFVSQLRNEQELPVAAERQREFDEAAGLFRRAIEIDATFVDAYSNLATVFKLRGQPVEAIAQYRAILQMFPRSPSAHYDLGIMLAQQNELDEAIDHFQQAIEEVPDFAEAHGYLATALQMQGNLDDAIRHYQEALRIAPGTPEMERRLQAALAER